MFQNISIAPLLYRNVMMANGGPIQKISHHQLETGEYQAIAFLNDKLAPNKAQGLYGNAHGSGTSRTLSVARHKAISEALERWAFYALHASGKFGFDEDPTTNGMACYPGIGFQGANTRARAEAVERHLIMAWWEKLITHTYLETGSELSAIELKCDLPNVHTVICWSKAEGIGHFYGFAAHRDSLVALNRAQTEALRNRAVLRQARANSPSSDQLTTAERRVLFFASAEGWQCFLDRLNDARPEPLFYKVPDPHFDGIVPGPWSKYGPVWRCCLKPPSKTFLGPKLQYFYF